MEENKQEPLSPRETPTEEIEVSAPAGAVPAAAQDAPPPPASTPPAGGKSIKKNYFYNLIYQLFLVVVPTVVTPYVARVLGDEGSGQYSFTYSLLTYFTLFAA
ncbi:MAG: oligosaccharide flippase family protein, partial [Eubacteriales bacterium]